MRAMTEPRYEQHPEHDWLKIAFVEGEPPAYFHECDEMSCYYDEEYGWYADRSLPASYCPGCGVYLEAFGKDSHDGEVHSEPED
jgi:hypothetical protein